MFGDSGAIEATDYFVQESGDDEPPRHRRRNSPAQQIKHFFFIDLPRSGSVSTLHVVRHYFESGHRAGLCVITQEKIAHLLISIGEMSMRLYSDQAAENAARVSA